MDGAQPGSVPVGGWTAPSPRGVLASLLYYPPIARCPEDKKAPRQTAKMHFWANARGAIGPSWAFLSWVTRAPHLN